MGVALDEVSWERQRLDALDHYHILDTPPDETYDDIVKLVCRSLDVPIAAVNLIAEHRQWFKSEIGLGTREMELDNSICARAILQSDFFVVTDTTKDERFDCNPLVTGAPGLRFYAGALLKTTDGYPIGTLCALDTKPRPSGVTPDQKLLMMTLARMVMNMLELRLVAERRKEALETEVADRLRAEEALRQSQKLEAIGQLTGGVAHDFNNLLTVIRGSIDLLRRPNLTEEKKQRYFDAIADTSDRAAALTGQLLAYARRQPLKPEVFDAAEQIKGVGDMLRSVVGSRVQVRLDLECDPCPVKADPNQFETSLLNLVVNARDAMTEGGEIRISIAHRSEIPSIRAHPAIPGRYVAVQVQDSGTGIASDRLEEIFAPFFTTKEVGKGTGLGLSQVIGFAKQSEGEIDVQSIVGQGSTFTLYLPRASEAVSFKEQKRPESREGRRGCVLLVEDNASVGAFAADSLQELGYESVLVTNAGDALTLLEADPRRFPVVFSDVVMPGMSGIELGRAIRARWPDIKIVLTSGYSHVLATEGGNGFQVIQKPYTLGRLDEALRSAAPSPEVLA
jgi:signal transduction histidine kinase/CheY-like chemotaxis protein